MGQRFIQEGAGWRLGWDDNAPTYQGLLAGSGWAVELTALEFKEFSRLAQQLAEHMQAIAHTLMDEERLTCEAESEVIWLEAEGLPQAFTLRFMVQSGRRCEGLWEPEATRELLQAIGQWMVF